MEWYRKRQYWVLRFPIGIISNDRIFIQQTLNKRAIKMLKCVKLCQNKIFIVGTSNYIFTILYISW